MDQFSDVFLRNCEEQQCKLPPNVKLIICEDEKSVVKFNTNLDFEQRELVVVFSNFRLSKVFYRNAVIDQMMVEALGKTLQDYPTLTTLKLEFCRLDADNVELLAGLLAAFPTIAELSVNGNPNAAQNHHRLLAGGGARLRSLSLRFCSVDAAGAAGVADALSAPGARLARLDLSTNACFDEGAAQVARLLRANRSLRSLALADNKIGCEGCAEIAAAFRRFALTQDEIVMRRRIRMERIRKETGTRRSSATSDSSRQTTSDTQSERLRRSKKRSAVKSTSSDERRRTREALSVELSRARSSTAPASDPPPPRSSTVPASDPLPPRSSKAPVSDLPPPRSSKAPVSDLPPPRSSKVPVSDLPPPRLSTAPAGDPLPPPPPTPPRARVSSVKPDKEYHPFVDDSYEEGDEIYCVGNYTLINLNLAYNNIQKAGLSAIADALRYQLAAFPDAGGLAHVSLQGNARFQCTQEHTAIGVLMDRRRMPAALRKVSQARRETADGAVAGSASVVHSLFATEG